MVDILDSGERREFSSGAVRDVQEGKGRCDLLPLSVVSQLKGDAILNDLDKFMKTKDVTYLYKAIELFCFIRCWDIDTCILEVARHYEAGAKKYEERNWEKGIPTHCFLDSGIRHYLKWHRGDKDEPHDRAFVWNLLGLAWTLQNRVNCDDLPSITDRKEQSPT